ncbi:MAG TPA: TolC family protein [Candidatus Binatia bacterium]|nr:TolC family protein [Candidatus Binatia bacterium]
MIFLRKVSMQLELFSLAVLSATLIPAPIPAADSPAPAQLMLSQTAAPQPGNVLTLDEAIQIALENHPSIKASKERIDTQQAVVGQQMAAYYPLVNMTNAFQTGSQTGSTTGVADRSFETYLIRTGVNMILYNFGKREGNVQSARDTLDATNFNYKTTIDGVILGVKQSYFTYLGLRALVKVQEETVKSRQLLARQAQGFYEVGTRARIDVARAESNLYLAEANLITAQNAVKVAWAILKNAMGLRELPERPLVEDVTMTPIPYALDEAKQIAFGSRPELKSFDAQRRAQDQLIAVARRGHLPDLLFDANYRRSNSSTAENTFPLLGGWQVGLSLLIPIFDGFRTTNRVQETLHTYYVIKSQEELQRQQVALDVEQAYLRLVELQERIKANESALNASKENLDLANGRYQVGVGSIIEATDAQTLYTEAQTTYIRTLYDYKIAEAQFIRAIGQ